jgi:hypothetical protein
MLAHKLRRATAESAVAVEKFLAVVHQTSPYVTIYGQDANDFTKLANPATLPTSTGNGVAFSADGTYMAVAHDVSPFVTIYKRSGDTFTKLANPATLPTNFGYGVAFYPRAFEGPI